MRLFSRSDREQMRERLKGPAVDHLSKLIELQNALEYREPFRIREAKKTLEEDEPSEPKSVRELYEAGTDPLTHLVDMVRFIQEVHKTEGGPCDLPEEEWLRRWQRRRPDFSDLHRKVCFELSTLINAYGIRLVFWWQQEGELGSAIYCNSLETAYYIHTLFISRAGVIGWRVCPRCQILFEQSRADQRYCSDAHGDAHRMARKRWEQKQKTETEMKRSKKNGDKKAR